MNQAFDVLFADRLASLTADLRYHHKPSGERVAPQIIHTMLPARDYSWQEGGECPFVRFAIYGGVFDFRRPESFKVVVSAGIYTDGDIATGTMEIMEFSRALSGLADRRSFAPFKLQTPISFEIGDPRSGNEGLQPHPYYYMGMTFNFIMP